MSTTFDLLTTVENGGCSAKIPPALLDKIVSDFKVRTPKELLVGTETHDDAAVWKISNEQALIFTTDFFPPLCSNPYDFGQIAATNSLSDVYAMGGDPLMALNIVTFPSTKIDIGVLNEILRGGSDKVFEAEAALCGGHTIDDDGAPKYGLAVVGSVHPNQVTTNRQVRPGDKLILTKPIGTGAVLAGNRLGEVHQNELNVALNSMKLLNKKGAAVMRKFNVKSATDVTGFSLLGHALKMAKGSKVTLHFHTKNIPLLPMAYELTDLGCIPGVTFKNLSYIENDAIFEKGLDYNRKMLALDAQTSGGLFFAIHASFVDEALLLLKNSGFSESSVVAEAYPLEEKHLRVF